MPLTSHVLSRGLLVSQIQKLIPRKWKQSAEVLGQGHIQASFTSSDDLMRDSFLTPLKGLISHDQLAKAFKAFTLIQLRTSSHDLIPHVISSLLLYCINLESVQPAKQLHGCIISLGLEQHPILVPKLVTFYSTLNFLSDAHVVTENSNIMNTLPWNLLISAYVRNGLCREALSAYKQIVAKGIKPDNFTYPSVLKACGEEFDIKLGREVHKSIYVAGLEWNLFVQNSLVSMYGRFGEVGVARDLFDRMPQKDAVSWNSMIAVYASEGMWESAFELFGRMRAEDTELNIIAWNTIAGGCLRTGNFHGALELLSQMRACGIHLDCVAMVIGLSACAHIRVVKLGRQIHGSVIRGNCDGYDNVQNSLITMYSRCGELEHAYTIFRLMGAKNVITWNSMISGYTHMDRYEEASFLFREMVLDGIEPNYVTIASILPLCARVANLQHCKEFHCYILRREGFKDYLLLWNALVDTYARSGKILEAKKVFNLLSKKDEVTYTSLIAGYGTQGKGQTALELFDEMKKMQIKPDHITMVAVLSACSHSGLVLQGEMVFDEMLSIYGITPRLEHFACMVDLFGRAGLLNKAKKFITKMPYQPSPAMWATLIGSCCIHGNTEIGEWAAGKLLEARPSNSGYYVLIANMYAAAGCWNKLAKVRTFMRDLGVRKAPGCAWVDAGAGFNSFLVGDTSNSHYHKIYPLLEGLTELMKDAGYNVIEEFSSDEYEELKELGNL